MRLRRIADLGSNADTTAFFRLLFHISRHGVATPYAKGTPLPEGSVKDMYLVPLRPDDSLDFLDLMPNSVLPRARTQNILLGVYVIERTCKELFPPEVLKARLASPPKLANTGSDSAPMNGAVSSHQRMLHLFTNEAESPVIADIKPYV